MFKVIIYNRQLPRILYVGANCVNQCRRRHDKYTNAATATSRLVGDVNINLARYTLTITRGIITFVLN